MKKSWLLALVLLFSFIGSYTPAQASTVLKEVEPNGTTHDAMGIQFGQTYEGVSGVQDEDFYQFTLSKPGKIEIIFQNNADVSWTFSLQNAKKHAFIGDVRTTNGNEKETIRSAGLPAGTYYLYVYGGSKDTALKPYQFSVTYDDVLFYEKEPNNDQMTANDMQFNQVYKGFSKSGDEDYFKFTLDKKTPITLSVKNHPQLAWYYELKDSKGTKFIPSTRTKTGTIVSDKIETHAQNTVTLPKGTYYVSIYGGNGHDNQYFEMAVHKGASFKDVPFSHWGNPSVEWAKEKGVVSGYQDGTFKPNEPLTEAQAVGIFTRFYDMKPTSGATSNHWAAGQYETLKKQGYNLKGYTNEKEKNKPITRGALAQLIYYGQGGKGSVEEAVAYMIKQDLTTAKTVKDYNPNGSLTRVHAAAFFHRIEEKGYTVLKR